MDKDVFARRVELECEEIPLDTTKSQTISSLMAGFQLPESAQPEWAKSVPEEVWKKNLLAQLDAKKTDLFANQAKWLLLNGMLFCAFFFLTLSTHILFVIYFYSNKR